MAMSEYEIKMGQLKLNLNRDRITVYCPKISFTIITLGEPAVCDGKYVKVTLKNETHLYNDTSSYAKV